MRKKISLMVLVIVVMFWLAICVYQGSRALDKMKDTIEDKYDYIENLGNSN